MGFSTQAIQRALWPEALGVGTYGVGMLVAASIDTAMKEQGNYQSPVAQNVVTYGSLVGGILGVGYNKATGFSKGLMYASAVGIVIRSLATLWEAARGESVSFSDIGTLIPRRAGSISRAPATGRGMGRGLSMGRQVNLQAGRRMPSAALSAASRPASLPAGVPSTSREFVSRVNDGRLLPEVTKRGGY